MKRMALLGPAILTALAVSPAAHASATASQGQARQVTAQVQRHAEHPRSRFADPYNRGYRDGFRQGVRDGREDCSLKQQYGSFGNKPSKYTRGYTAGYLKGYYSVCGSDGSDGDE